MDINILFEFTQRQQLRDWLQENHATAKECWVVLSRSKNPPAGVLPYLDVVEEALCFGWIDSTLKKLPAGRLAMEVTFPDGFNKDTGKCPMVRLMHGIGDGILKAAIRKELDEVLALRCSYCVGDQAVTIVTIV